MGTNISTVSFTAQFAPRMKRAVATLSDGTAVAIVPDPNLATQTGADDVTGTMRFRIYRSDAARTTWTLNATYTPGTAACSATIAAVVSMALDSANGMHIVYQGIDNTLQYKHIPFTGSVYDTAGAPASQVVVVANAVTNRYRAVDIDVTGTGTTANVAIIAYESKASAGPSAWLRVYIRNNGGSVWRVAYTEDQSTLGGGNIQIYANSEDVSIAWNQTGIVSNVGQVLIYACRIGTTFDRGDVFRELQYNVSTGVDGSATVLGTWPVQNQNVGVPYRRGWIYKTANNIWQVAFVAGLVSPKFSVARLTHNVFTAPQVDSVVPAQSSPRNALVVPLTPQITANVNSYNYIACTYADNRVFFAFTSRSTPTYIGIGVTYSMAGIIFRYDNISATRTSYKDSIMRAADGYFQYGEAPIGIYGNAQNRAQSGDFKFNFVGLYGYLGNTSNGTKLNKARFILDSFFDAPVVTSPTGFAVTDTPVLQAKIQNSSLYPNVKGKIEWQLATNNAFTVSLRSVVEPDSNYRYFGSTSASTPPPILVSYKMSGIGSERLATAFWFIRARVVSDLGQVSAWSPSENFTVTHAPTALPKYPQPGSLIEYGTGTISFNWQFSDSEPTDNQSAYQIVIVRTDTGATVLDTGKVTSTDTSAQLAISDTLKDITLQWTVSLWDSDNAQGPFSNPTLFTLGDAPIVAIASPTAGGIVATAAPTVTWTFTGGGTRTQRAFRVAMHEADLLDSMSTVTSGGWGNSDNLIPWSVKTANAAQFSKNGTSGFCAVNAVATDFIITAPINEADGEMLIQVSVPAVALTANANMDVVTRYIDANNYYKIRFEFRTDGTVGVGLLKVVGGVQATPQGGTSTGQVYNPGDQFIARVSQVGTRIRSKIYLKTAGDPPTWNMDIQDTSLQDPGDWGIRFFLTTGNTNTSPYTFTVDNLMFANTKFTPVADSKWVQSAVNSYTFPTNVLLNNKTYSIYLEVQDTGGLRGLTLLGVNTLWTHPALGDVTVITDEFGPTISWTNANIDLSFISWRLYRRYQVPALADLDDDDTANSWELLYETTDNLGPYSFKDYLAPLNKSVDYAVVQVADRFESIIESNITSFSTIQVPADRYFFVPSVPIGTIASYEAANVTDDSFQDETEQATLHIIGRGRQVQVGDDLGVTGTLTIQLRGAGARADREFIQRLASSKTINVWMKNPFGDVKYVKFGNPGIKFLAGVGQTEMSDLTVPYTEVFAPEPIMRSV